MLLLGIGALAWVASARAAPPEPRAAAADPAPVADAAPAGGPAGRSTLPLETALWRAPSGEVATIDDIGSRDFVKFDGATSFGNVGADVWVRAILPPRPGRDGDWVLLLEPPMLQEAEIYIPGAGGSWQVTANGNRFPFSTRKIRNLNVAVPVPAGAAPMTIYVRMQSINWAIKPSLVTAQHAQEFDSLMHVAAGAYSGLCLLLALAGVFFWVAYRDPLWLMNSLFDLVSLVQAVAQLGFVARYVLPDSSALASQFQVAINCTHLAVALTFYSMLFSRFSSRRWTPWPFRVALATFPVELLALALGHDRLAQTICQATLLAISAAGLGLLWFLDPRDRVLRGLLRGLNVVLVSLLVAIYLPAFIPGMPVTALHFYPCSISNIATMLVLVSALLRDTQLRNRASRKAVEQRLLAEQHLTLERRQHEETSGLLGMLMHEIRTPLALIQATTRGLGRSPALGSHGQEIRRIDDSVGSITRVLERCAQTDQLERGGFGAKPESIDVVGRLGGWLRSLPEASRVDLRAPPSCLVTLDPHLWLLMVGNLVDNALKYSPPPSTITLRLGRVGDHLELLVQNELGEAGPPDPEQVFRKHYRAPAASHLSGTGLGLYWVKLISRRLGGDVRLCTPPDARSSLVTFALSVPAVAGLPAAAC